MLQHLSEVEAVADGMLARLDELTATLGTVRRCARRARSPRSDAASSQVSGDAAQQQTMLAPAYRSITAGLARDFAYIDGVGVRCSDCAHLCQARSRVVALDALQDALVNVRAAVQKMEAELALAEAALFKCARSRARCGAWRRLTRAPRRQRAAAFSSFF